MSEKPGFVSSADEPQSLQNPASQTPSGDDCGTGLTGRRSFLVGATVLGFCYGGRMAMLYGARSRDVDVAVPFHPGEVAAGEVARLKAPVRVHCGAADRHVSVADIRDLGKTLRAQSTPVELHFCEGAGHGFLAYTRPFYKPDAARLARARATQFLQKHLK